MTITSLGSSSSSSGIKTPRPREQAEVHRDDVHKEAQGDYDKVDEQNPHHQNPSGASSWVGVFFLFSPPSLMRKT